MAEKTIERRREPFEWWPWPDIVPRRFLDWFEPEAEEGMRRMHVEEFMDGNDLVIRAEVPGIDPDKDVEIHVRKHVLELRAERKEETTKEDKGTRRSEFHYGTFYRAVTLPPDASDADVHATYKDGILEVRVPCDRKQAEPTKVPVQRG